MIAVISPAKTLDFATPPLTKVYSEPVFLSDSAKLIRRLKKMTAKELSSLMRVSDKIAQLNYARYRAWKKPFTPNNSKQAILAFKGDVYTGLDVESFTAADFKFAQKHLCILSGLYGVLRSLDLIQPYRLEMGTRFEVGNSNNLYQFWNNRITDQLNNALHAEKNQVLVNLASNEYFKSVKPSQLNARIVTPVFKERRKGVYKVISFSAKKARGMMSRYIIKNRLQDINVMKKFRQADYRYHDKLSDEDTWVFARG